MARKYTDGPVVRKRETPAAQRERGARRVRRGLEERGGELRIERVRRVRDVVRDGRRRERRERKQDVQLWCRWCGRVCARIRGRRLAWPGGVQGRRRRGGGRPA